MEKEQEFYKQDIEMLHRLCKIKQLGVPMMNLSDIASFCHVHTQEDVDTLFRLRERNLIVFEEANGALQKFDITSEGLLETDWLNYFSSAIIDFFEELLDKKDIFIPCEDPAEEAMRYEGGNSAHIYGMEYADLVTQIGDLLIIMNLLSH